MFVDAFIITLQRGDAHFGSLDELIEYGEPNSTAHERSADCTHFPLRGVMDTLAIEVIIDVTS